MCVVGKLLKWVVRQTPRCCEQEDLAEEMANEREGGVASFIKVGVLNDVERSQELGSSHFLKLGPVIDKGERWR